MPSSSQPAATERLNNDRTIPPEPPKLKTTLKTPPKQATNPLQFVKVGPCSLYRTAQEQLQKVQEVKKIKPEVRDDPEDWQSNLDNWKSSRRKRQEHIIERVVEVKKLELEEHDRQRRRSKTFSEMMEERGNREGRKLSLSLAVYNEEDANDLSDLGIGTSSGKSSISGDTHDDTHSVLSDRDSEIDKNHSDVDNVVGSHETNGNDANENGNSSSSNSATKSSLPAPAKTTTNTTIAKNKEISNNGLQRKNGTSSIKREYSDSATTATASSPEPEEYTYEGAIRGYVSRVSQNIPRRSLVDLDAKLEASNGKQSSLEDKDKSSSNGPVVKVDILKRREIFEKAANSESNKNNQSSNRLDFASGKSIKERLSILEKQKAESEALERLSSNSPRHSIDNSSLRERFKQSNGESAAKEQLPKTRDLLAEELEAVKPLRERLSNLEKLAASTDSAPVQYNNNNGELSAKSIKERLISLDASRAKEQQTNSSRANENSTPSERSSSPDSEYRAPRATFHRSLDSLDADASSGPDTFERVQSLEELDYQQTAGANCNRRYPASTSSAEILNDTDREDSGIHTADASCSVSQADEPIEEDSAADKQQQMQQQQTIVVVEEKTEFRGAIEATLDKVESRDAVLTETGTAEISCSSSTSTSGDVDTTTLSANSKIEPLRTNATTTTAKSPDFQATISSSSYFSTARPVVYQSPRVPPRRTPPESLPVAKPSYLPVLSSTSTSNEPAKDDFNNSSSLSESLSTPDDSSSTNTICSLNFGAEPDITIFKNLQTVSSSGSLSPGTPSISSPLPSPRSPSKIPTPLPRKSLPSSPASPTPPPKFPLPPSPSKTRISASEIPVPVSQHKVVVHQSPPATPSSPLSTPTSPARCSSGSTDDSRRRTVVEVCEKVVVSPGRALVTPFITVEATTSSSSSQQADKSHEDEQKQQQENQPVAAAAATEPPTAAEPKETSIREEGSEQELAEKEENNKKKNKNNKPEKRNDEQQQQQQQTKQTVPTIVMESALLVQETVAALQIKEPMLKAKKMEQEIAIMMNKSKNNNNNNNNNNKEKEEFAHVVSTTTTTTAAVRPTTLALEKTTLCPDFLSPMSPVSKQILPLSFSSDEEVINGLSSFPLGPPTSVEPPKEKPPPPPVELSDEENQPIEPLKRLNSTRRIKKELRTRRSDFLGIEGGCFNDDEAILERELILSKPPDMAAILAEERRIEQLHRRSYDTDSNYEQDSSHERDSGVELGQAEDWAKQPVSPDMSQHSRQSSEPFGASVTSSEEDEISKKEREIIEVLEREEQWRYENNREVCANDSDIGEKLAHKLRELEEEKMQLERERASQETATNAATNETQEQQPQMQMQQQQQQPRRPRHQEPTPETRRLNEENLRKQEEAIARKQEEARKLEEQKRIQDARRQEEIQKQQQQQQKKNKPASPALSCNEEEYASRQEVLRVERELLQLEQDELKRQRNLAYREQKQQQQQLQQQEQWKSMQDVAQPAPQPQLRQPYNKPLPAAPLVNYRASMPNLQLQETTSLAQRRRPPPPPIPPAKPLRLVEQRQRIGLPIVNSRVPSADSIPQQVDAPLRPSCSATALSSGHHGQQMSRQTLQALSAVPRSRIVQGDQWVQRRKSDIPRGAHDINYQHWLIQEAEQRRISEKNFQRMPARKPHVTGTSVPYTASQPRNDNKPLPDSIIQTLTQRVQNRAQEKPLSPRRRLEHSASQEHLHTSQNYQQMQPHKVHQSPHTSSNNISNNNNSISSNNNNNSTESQEKMLSVSGKKKCSHCGDELGRGAAMIIESLRLFYHMECFKCCVCHVRLGDGLMGTDVRVRNHKLHCHNCYSSDDGVKFSCV